MTSDMSDVVARLEVAVEALADLALERLRAAVDGDAEAVAQERRITRARRAVEKAIAILREDGTDD